MLGTRVLPCLLMQDRGLVKTRRFRSPDYVGDPINAVKIFNEKEIDELVLLDIKASRQSKSPDFDIIEQIASECFSPLAYGGGIRTMEELHRLFRSGIEKAVINTQVAENPQLIQKASATFGAQSVVVSMDVKRTWWGGVQVVTRGGGRVVSRDPIAYAQQAQALGAGEIFLNSVNHDGMMDGMDYEMIRAITQAVSIPVIAAGGMGSLDHLKQAVEVGHASAVAAGAFFVYYGPHRAVLINYPSQAELAARLPSRTYESFSQRVNLSKLQTTRAASRAA